MKRPPKETTRLVTKAMHLRCHYIHLIIFSSATTAWPIHYFVNRWDAIYCKYTRQVAVHFFSMFLKFYIFHELLPSSSFNQRCWNMLTPSFDSNSIFKVGCGLLPVYNWSFNFKWPFTLHNLTLIPVLFFNEVSYLYDNIRGIYDLK